MDWMTFILRALITAAIAITATLLGHAGKKLMDADPTERSRQLDRLKSRLLVPVAFTQFGLYATILFTGPFPVRKVDVFIGVVTAITASVMLVMHVLEPVIRVLGNLTTSTSARKEL